MTDTLNGLPLLPKQWSNELLHQLIELMDETAVKEEEGTWIGLINTLEARGYGKQLRELGIGAEDID